MSQVDLERENASLKKEIESLRSSVMQSARNTPVYVCGLCGGTGRLSPYLYMIYELSRDQMAPIPTNWDESVALTDRYLKMQELKYARKEQ